MLYRNFSKLQLFFSELGSAYINTVVTTSELEKSVFYWVQKWTPASLRRIFHEDAFKYKHSKLES